MAEKEILAELEESHDDETHGKREAGNVNLRDSAVRVSAKETHERQD